MVEAFTAEQVEAFHRDGSLIVEEGLIPEGALERLRERYLRLFEGEYQTGIRPDEVNWVPGRDPEDRTRQLCNAWKSDTVVAAQVLSERTGRLAAQLMGYAPDDWLEGARAASPDGSEPETVPVVVKAGGGSFHQGLTWHGSAPNRSDSLARMAPVSHMIPVEARFHETNVDVTYSRYRRRGDLSLDESFFPVMWTESGYRTPWLAELPQID
jgi:hypothetical protein